MITCDALRDLVPFVQFKKRENTHEGVLLLVKFQAKHPKNLAFEFCLQKVSFKGH